MSRLLLTDVGEKGDTENVHLYTYVISPLQNHWFISCIRAWDEALFTMADTSSYLGVSAECYSLRLSAQTVSCEGTGSFISVLCPWLQ